MADSEYRPTWENRRRVIILSLLFCAAVIGYSVFEGGTSTVREAAVQWSFITAIAVIGSYVFGSAWDDKNILGAGRPAGGGAP